MTPAVRRRAPLAAALLAAAWLPAADDAEVAAARAALAAGQPVEAEALVESLPGAATQGPARLIRARARVALGRPAEALSLLGVTDAKNVAAAVDRWSTALRGEAAQIAAEALLATPPIDHALVSALLQCALDHPGQGVEPDRCLVLFTQSCLLAGRTDAGIHAAETLWQDWPRSRYRVRGGLVLARAISATDATRAREILSAIRVDPATTAPDRLDASEELCRILLEVHAGQCLVVAEQEVARLGSHPTGALALYHALALARLDPPAGVAALRALTGDLAADPAVAPAVARAEAARTSGAAPDAANILERAHAAAELGRVAEARRLLEPLAAHHAQALAALADLPGSDAPALARLPSARDPQAVLAVVRALVACGDLATAHALIADALARARAGVDGPLPASDVLYWASRCAGDAAAARAVRAELFALRRNDLATALGWCAEAEDLDRGGTDAAEAWGRAAAMLPPHHPWRPEAAWRAARNLVAAGDLEGARALLDGEASWGGDGEPHLRCRYLLVQVLERGGDRVGALRAAESIAAALPPEADAERRVRVEGVIRRLRQDH